MASDADLIGRSLAGDGEAFVGVVCRHEVAVGAYLARRAGPGVATDLLSEVWLAAFGSRSTYDRSFPDARPWLFGVARNVLRRHWRSRPAEEPLPDTTDLEVGWDPWPAVDERFDTAAALRTAVMRLRPAEREVLIADGCAELRAEALRHSQINFPARLAWLARWAASRSGGSAEPGGTGRSATGR